MAANRRVTPSVASSNTTALHLFCKMRQNSPRRTDYSVNQLTLARFFRSRCKSARHVGDGGYPKIAPIVCYRPRNLTEHAMQSPFIAQSLPKESSRSNMVLPFVVIQRKPQARAPLRPAAGSGG